MIEFLNWLDGVLWGLPLIVLMISTGIYFTVRSGFFQFRRFGWILKNTGGTILNKKSQVENLALYPRPEGRGFTAHWIRKGEHYTLPIYDSN